MPRGTAADDRRTLLIARAEEAARIGSWELDLTSGELLWSDNMFRIFGLEPGELTPNLDFALSRVHVDDRGTVVAFVAALRDGQRRLCALFSR